MRIGFVLPNIGISGTPEGVAKAAQQAEALGYDSLWVTDLKPLRFVKLDFSGNRLYTWHVPSDLPDGYLEVHTFSVDSAGNLYGGDNQHGRTQKFVPRPGADVAHLIRSPWVAR